MMTITLPATARIHLEGDSVRIDLNDKDAAKALFDELEAMQPKPKPDEAERIYREIRSVDFEMRRPGFHHGWRTGSLEDYDLAAIAHLRTELARIKDTAWNEALEALINDMSNSLTGAFSVNTTASVGVVAAALKRPVA